ncbi:TetR/AcrR family transcriptional regulator [Nocardia sp. NPDC050175]|uniref:TetR/AcrR family transcriptional regulator n=1 Tax=Nocardia sp. NPDC050175 TaxID=3364317 RepID=UPI00379C36E6
MREEILRAAEQLLIETGTEDSLTVRAVAQRAGISTPSVYLHFADRETLVEAVCLRAWEKLDDLMCTAIQEAPDPFVALGQCARVYIRFALEYPVQYRILIMRPATGPETQAAATVCVQHFVDTVSVCVEAGVLHGNPQTLALSLWSAAHGCASLVIAQPSFPWPQDLDAVIEQTIRMAGFGAALSSRLPSAVTPDAAELAAGLDDLTARWNSRDRR